MRNLNDYEIGGRQLRVDYAAMDDSQNRQNHQGPGNANNFNNQNRQYPPAPMNQQPPPPVQPPMPMQAPPPVQAPPVVPPPNLSSVDEISKVLASMNSQDLFTLMSQMKVRKRNYEQAMML